MLTISKCITLNNVYLIHTLHSRTACSTAARSRSCLKRSRRASCSTNQLLILSTWDSWSVHCNCRESSCFSRSDTSLATAWYRQLMLPSSSARSARLAATPVPDCDWLTKSTVSCCWLISTFRPWQIHMHAELHVRCNFNNIQCCENDAAICFYCQQILNILRLTAQYDE